MKNWDLNLLVVLDALLDERNGTRAAKRLGVTQPAVSGALARLRTAFGDPLFTRVQRGLVPTPRALAIAADVKRIVREAEDLLRPVQFDPETAAGPFSIATTDYMQATLAMPLMRRLRRTAPHLTLTVRSLEAPDIAERLERGEIDLAITIPEFAAAEWRQRLLYRERYVGMIRKGHPIAKKKSVSLSSFCTFPHALVVPRGGAAHGPVDDALAAKDHARRIALTVPNFLILPHALRQTDLVAVGPERLFQTFTRDMHLFELPVDLPPFDVIAVWHPRMHNDPRHRWFRGALAEVASKV